MISQLVIGDGDVVEVYVGGERPADLVTTGQQHERAARLGSGGDVAAHRFRERLAVERVDPVELEAQRVARDDAALDDRHVEVDLGA